MKLLKLYEWAIGKQSDFLRKFDDNDQLYNQARAFWAKLESNALWLALIAVATGALVALYYYFPYNEQPGRHYRLTHWAYFLVIAVIVSIAVTFGFEAWQLQTSLAKANNLKYQIIFANAIYAAGIYALTSVVVCLTSTKTNAYKFI